MTRRSLRASLVVAVLALAGCTGVPTSSQPRTVQPIDIGGGTDTRQSGPTRGDDPRTIVQDFLAANSVDTDGHDTARKYLTPGSRDDWSDSTASIISARSVSTFEKGVITVRGRLVGSLTQNGVYVPQLQGTGDGGSVVRFQYRVVKVRGENRIIDPPSGLLITTEQFSQAYQQHPLYFFDQARRYLVPDLRWSSLDGARLNTWLVSQLATGPRPDLTSTLTADTVPTQANSRRITATADSPIEVEVPGSAQLDARGKTRLAAQISATLTDTTSSQLVVLTDGGTPVRMPASQGAEFSASEFYGAFSPTPPAPDVYYLRDGDIVDEAGRALTGRLSDSPFFLGSIAVSRPGDGPGLSVAAVTNGGTQLVLGTQTAGYRQTTVRGELSRPAWAPAPPIGSSARPEVWIGAGGRLLRVEVDGNRGTPSVVSVNSGAGGGRIVAVRLSPEGSRIALVIQSPNGSRRLFMGAVVRSAGQVRVDSLPAISPEGVVIDDAAWIGTQKLIAVGSIRSSGDPRIFETNDDGSFWTGRTIGSTLPEQPDSVTVAVGQLAWVSSNKTVWEQFGRSWSSPGPTDQTVGDAPVYLE